MNPKVDLGRIRSLREEHGYTFAKVSEALGFKSQQGYYYKEKGVSTISADELGKLATLYDVPVASLYTQDAITA